MLDKLEMKAIKLAQWKSQETYCYEANVYLDGKPFAIVGNDGHGGCDYQHEHPKFKGEFYPTLKKLDEEFAKLPYTDKGKYKNVPEGFKQTFERWCNEQVGLYEVDKEIKRTLKNNIVAQIMEADKDGGAYVDLLPVVKVVQWKIQKGYEQKLRDIIMKQHPEAKIVNDMPMEKVREIWEGLPRG
tara:strand:- start:497 stop:1051 length:555 start_codon:yes stop_codon:yes gene_type:complete